MSTTPGALDPYADPLSASEMKEAVQHQIVNYRKVTRANADPPVPNQTIALLSYNLFPADKIKTLPNGSVVHGFAKVRGCYSDVSSAQFAAGKLVKEFDSKFPILLAPVGKWLPITEELANAKQIDIQDEGEAESMRSEAAHLKREQNKRRQNEIEAREKELVEGGDIYDDEKSLDFYTMKRNTEMNLVARIEQHHATIKSIEKSLHDTLRITREIEQEHPEYTNQWVENMNKERRKAGVPDCIPSDEYLEIHNTLELPEVEEPEEEKNVTFAEASDRVAETAVKGNTVDVEGNVTKYTHYKL